MAIKDDPSVKEGVKELKKIFKFLFIAALVFGALFGGFVLFLMFAGNH